MANSLSAEIGAGLRDSILEVDANAASGAESGNFPEL
jgi:hypothetical protein